ncbi:hypothetical protein ABTY96_03165 [Streptomyces sp. NPDC096057]|uniref:hypothetical protein n=1 Tax=Streptomyces sp. NPDC096057 TaxID=3155543 RepID=UPI003334479D
MARIIITNEQIKAAQGGDAEVMWQIVEELDGMVRGLIRQVAPRATREQSEDYLQEGRATVLQLIRDYDTTVSSATLSSFVYRAVRRTIAEADAAESTPLTIDPTAAIRVKHALWEAGGDIDKAWATFRDAESASKRMARESFIAMIQALAGAESLDTPVTNGGGAHGDGRSEATLADTIADPSDDITDPTERRDYARWLMTQLTPRHSYVLRATFGVGMAPVPDVEVAAELGMNRLALRRLRTRGYESARRVAAANLWAFEGRARRRLATAA